MARDASGAIVSPIQVVKSAMLADKCGSIAETGAAFCAALDSSCLLQIGGGLSRRGSATRPVHLAEILASS